MRIPLIIFIFLASFHSLAFAGDDNRPNLVLILARDLTRGHLECYGGNHPSPNIDRLAKEGVRYETAWRMPDENLSKRTLFSGRYPSHHEKAPALSALLEQSGYQNGGMNTDLEKSLSFLAQAQGSQPFFMIHFVGSEGAKVDHQVGKLLSAIEKNEFKENTLVMLTSEGGSGKGKTDLEVRVPFIVRAPFLVGQGRVSKDLVDFTDILPTFLSLAKIAKTDALKSDGKSMVPSLTGSDDPFEKRNWICSESEGFRMVRDWQHILDTEGNFHDLRSDPRQAKEVSPLDKQAPGRRTRLQMMLDRFL